MSQADDPQPPPRRSVSSDEDVGGDPSSVMGALRGLGKVAAAAGLLIVAAGAIAAVVALLY